MVLDCLRSRGWLERGCIVFSQYFEVKIDAEAAGYKRTYYAVIYRPRGRDAQTIRFYSN